ncbi:MAG TPA: biopolymer transporter ExbD [Phycisphaerae bacterium]|nr:biopolymer transporter ExbD [Phycisphaerae bacterium]
MDGNNKKVEEAKSDDTRAQRKACKARKGRFQPPMTSMIDVTFLLLIFFILTSSYSESEGQLPATVPMLGDGDSFVTRTVEVMATGENSNGVIYRILETDTRYHDPESLYTALEGYKSVVGKGWKEHVTITIYPRYNVCWGYAIEAYNQAIRAGYEKVSWASIK